MKKLILSLALIAPTAFAQITPEMVASECVQQMALGICKAIPDRSLLVPGQTMLLGGVGRVSSFAYQDYMDQYNPAVPSDPKMCDLAMHYMSIEPGGDHDKIARALWTPVPKPNQKAFVLPSALAAAAIATAMGIAAAAAFAVNRKKEKAL